MTYKFQVTSGRVAITDPCYDPADLPEDGPGKNEIAANVAAVNGEWKCTAYYTDNGKTVEHVTYVSVERAGKSFETTNMFRVCVDAGMVGVFDLDQFKKNWNAEYNEVGSFYRTVCDGTMDGDQVALLEFGAATSSGYGDGSYDVVVYLDAEKNATAIEVTFVVDDYDDEWEDDYWEDEEDWDEDDQ